MDRQAESGSLINFSLKECVIVCVITGFVAAMLFPVFVRARETSSQVTCASNLAQLGRAFSQYAQDNDQKYPVGPLGAFGSRWGNGWAGAISPDVKNVAAFKCPDDATVPAANENDVSFVLNARITSDSPVEGAVAGSLAKVTMPARTICLLEAQGQSAVLTNAGETGSKWLSSTFDQSNMLWKTGSGNEVNASGDDQLTAGHAPVVLASGEPAYWKTLPSACQSWWGSPSGRHDEAANYLMCDGHVQCVLPKAVTTMSAADTNGPYVVTFSVQ
ncbi:MAG: hypothetical protein P4L33_14350 [Capsulimonadaceae bacterium]|nr:hypothetical protein [Capsulimonadaceae bacterium]